jgi:hypothetical protein
MQRLIAAASAYQLHEEFMGNPGTNGRRANAVKPPLALVRPLERPNFFSRKLTFRRAK